MNGEQTNDIADIHEYSLNGISVAERLPSEGEFVLVQLESLQVVLAGQYADTFNGPAGFTDLDGNYFDEGDVLYWLPMPKSLHPPSP